MTTTKDPIKTEYNKPKMVKYFVTFNDEKFSAEHHFIYNDGTVKTISEHRWKYEERIAKAKLYVKGHFMHTDDSPAEQLGFENDFYTI